MLLKILNCHVSLAEQFSRLNGNLMMAKLFSTSKCVSGYKLLKVGFGRKHFNKCMSSQLI